MPKYDQNGNTTSGNNQPQKSWDQIILEHYENNNGITHSRNGITVITNVQTIGPIHYTSNAPPPVATSPAYTNHGATNGVDDAIGLEYTGTLPNANQNPKKSGSSWRFGYLGSNPLGDLGSTIAETISNEWSDITGGIGKGFRNIGKIIENPMYTPGDQNIPERHGDFFSIIPPRPDLVTGDAIAETEEMLRRGGPLMVGSAKIYGGGSMNAFEAMTTAGQYIQTMSAFAAAPFMVMGAAAPFLCLAGLAELGGIAAMGGTLYTMGMWGPNAYNAYNAFAKGDYFGGMLSLMDMLPGGACFAAGTPIRTPNGWRLIEEIQVGDKVLSRNEFDPFGSIESKSVQEIYLRETLIWHLHVGDMTIRTTAEHPFYVQDRGWTTCNTLKAGDLLLTEGMKWLAVTDMQNTNQWEKVYNFSIEEYHTYFVACKNSDLSIWAHNTSCDSKLLRKALGAVGWFGKIGEQAAHLVPTGSFAKRAAEVREAIEKSRQILRRAGIGLNDSLNGFFAFAGHNGTHSDRYFLDIYQRLRRAEMSGHSVADELISIGRDALTGHYLFF